MKKFMFFVMLAIVSIVMLIGCAPSVTVMNTGNESQYEVSVNSQVFSLKDPEELVEEWHKEAKHTCNGRNYKVITRDIIDKDELNGLYITGIIECEEH